MEPLTHPIKTSFERGAAKGWQGFLWMSKIILPVSFVTFLLDYSGWLDQMDSWLEPLMGAIHLPAMAALPLLAGLLTGIYGAIAAISVLPFTVDQMTLMAVFLLIITALMVFMEILKRYRLIDRVVRIIEPILGLLGLDRQVGVLWL